MFKKLRLWSWRVFFIFFTLLIPIWLPFACIVVGAQEMRVVQTLFTKEGWEAWYNEFKETPENWW
ncbi:hypothetical protein [Desulfovibrio oxyclinae]|uniref:hypothetical protein n=1 Tax=Desulfovibrio oxyclinae TaxID=63560 RepID=UPI0003663A50|nr:hypothetical protein [Desulfovibrio oxyclinae]